ncbi:MAG: RHS repeat-associated core domain-containing protein, partial [Bacilli bacterium]|nr:RHS repeat-associated core domain-containing protein [Bacilli bacterium]
TKITDNLGNDVQNNLNHIANINPFRYRSYYYDSETKLYYLNSRYYNPLWDRFLNMDSYGGELGGNPLTHNLFAYALNNPIINIDKYGSFAPAIPIIVKDTLKVIAVIAAAVAITKTAEIFVPKAISATRRLKNHTLTIDEPKKDSVKVQEAVKVETVVPYAPTIDEYKPCTTAWINPITNDVDRGERLTIDESIQQVYNLNSVMCDNRIYAEEVAQEWKGQYYDDKIHGGGADGYYPHFHPWNKKSYPNIKVHPHIWYLP